MQDVDDGRCGSQTRERIEFRALRAFLRTHPVRPSNYWWLLNEYVSVALEETDPIDIRLSGGLYPWLRSRVDPMNMHTSFTPEVVARYFQQVLMDGIGIQFGIRFEAGPDTNCLSNRSQE